MKSNPISEDRLKEILDERFDNLNNRLDEVMGELETIRQEQTIGYHQFKELEEKVNKHEERIGALENPHS